MESAVIYFKKLEDIWHKVGRVPFLRTTLGWHYTATIYSTPVIVSIFFLQCIPLVRWKPWALVMAKKQWMLSLGTRCLPASMSVRNDDLVLWDKGQKKKNNPSWESEGVVCHALKNCVPEVTGNEGLSFTALPSLERKSMSPTRNIRTENRYETLCV